MKASGAISPGFEKCGLWPSNEDAINYVHGNEQLSANHNANPQVHQHQCLKNGVSVWVAPAFIKSNGKKRTSVS